MSIRYTKVVYEEHNMPLTSRQIQAVDALDWLHSNERATGRSTAQAIHYIRRAMANPGLRVDVEDHYVAEVGRRRGNRDITAILCRTIREIVGWHGMAGVFEARLDGLLIYHGRPVADWWPEPELFREGYDPGAIMERTQYGFKPRGPSPTLWEHLDEAR